MSSRQRKWLHFLVTTICGLGMAVAALGVFSATAFAHVIGGVNTTYVDASQCLNGSQVNCNNYASKAGVYMSGNPSQLSAGTYFYAVLDPGGQPNPIDGAPKNLSSSCDTYTNREFTVDASGNITPVLPTTHLYQSLTVGKGKSKFTNTAIQVGDPTNSCYFANTANPGGVYILAVCDVTNYPNISPSDCKYDAFKVKAGSTTLSAVFSGTKFLDADKDGMFDASDPALSGWTINIYAGSSASGSPIATTTTDNSGNWSLEVDNLSGTSSSQFTVCEQISAAQAAAGWFQTGPVNTNTVNPMGSASLTGMFSTPPGVCYQVTVDPANGNGVITGLDFFNTESAAPSCTIVGAFTTADNVKYAQVEFQDAGSGLKSVLVTESNNTNISTAAPNPNAPSGPFYGVGQTITIASAPGFTQPFDVYGYKIDQSLSSQIMFTVTDFAGNQTSCDPVMSNAVRADGKPVSQNMDGVTQADHLAHIYNQGASNLKITVNGHDFKLNGMSANQVSTIDISSALTSGTNTVTLTISGRPGGSVNLLLGDI